MHLGGRITMARKARSTMHMQPYMERTYIMLEEEKCTRLMELQRPSSIVHYTRARVDWAPTAAADRLIDG